jgi:hypothetical protein
MGVGIGARVVQRHPAAGVEAAREPELVEQVERRVHGGQREAGQPIGGGPPHLLGGGVAAELAQRPVELQALARDAAAALAQAGGERDVGIGNGGGHRIGLGDPYSNRFAIMEGVTTARVALASWRGASERQRLLQVVQPALIGLIDGTVSTLAPIFASAYVAGTRAALLVGLAAALGAAISMGLSEALSDDGAITGRGRAVVRGAITGGATFLGGSLHALPFLINDLSTALTVAYIVVTCELVAIAWVRQRWLRVPWPQSLVQVTLGGFVVALVGFAVGHA